ncbi:MAG: hypothetical protein H7Y03_10970 [Chitinophagaceae bacterium]|nr:hypothetical protein [Chitinophagaceae bacterium]
MNQYEVPALIADELPEVAPDLRFISAIGNVNESIAVLTTYTRKMILSHKFYQANKCMQLACKIYNKGNNAVRSAVENVFIYSFSFIRMSCNTTEWQLVRASIPMPLYSAYIKQVMGPGC